MKNTFSLHQSRLTAAAQQLDEAAALCEDAGVYQRLLHLKEQALGCHANHFFPRRSDRHILNLSHQLLISIQRIGDLWEILRLTEQIETALYEREHHPSSKDNLAEGKRALFIQWRHQAAEIDYWSNRRNAAAQQSLDCSEHEARIAQEQFETCSRRLMSLERTFQQTWLALRAMDSVLLMQDEESGLRTMEQLYRTHLPDADEFQNDLWRAELRRETLNEKLDSIANPKKKL